MKIFISWSGDLSNKIAEELAGWIPCVIQTVDVFYSPEDIEKGENWSSRLSQELATCNYGIVCLTKHNVTAPWINFEAGALAKVLDSRLTSLMIDIQDSDVKGPLSRFQNTKLEKGEIFRLIQSINRNNEVPLKDRVLEDSFDAFWPRLGEAISKITQDSIGKKSSKSDENPKNEAIEEILRIVRKLDGKFENASPAKNTAPYYKKDGTLNATKIDEIRWSKSMSLGELAEKTGLSFSTISHVTRSGNCSLSIAMKIANALGVTLDDLVCSEPDQEKNS